MQALIVTVGYDVTNMQRSDEGEHTGRYPGRVLRRQLAPVAS